MRAGEEEKEPHPDVLGGLGDADRFFSVFYSVLLLNDGWHDPFSFTRARFTIQQEHSFTRVSTKKDFSLLSHPSETGIAVFFIIKPAPPQLNMIIKTHFYQNQDPGSVLTDFWGYLSISHLSG